MVNLTNIVYARITPTLFRKPDDVIGRAGFGRKNIQEKDVPYIERTPLALKNRVSLKSTKDRNKACFKQMMEVISCMSKFDHNQTMCDKEITSFNSCYQAFQAKQEDIQKMRLSGDLPLGNRAKMTGEQMNQYMQQFPLNNRRGQFNADSAYKDMYKFK